MPLDNDLSLGTGILIMKKNESQIQQETFVKVPN